MPDSKFTVVSQSGKWKDDDIFSLVKGLGIEAYSAATAAKHLVLNGEHAREAVQEALGYLPEGFECLVVTGRDNPSLPFPPQG